jgi:hypothetical protein
MLQLLVNIHVLIQNVLLVEKAMLTNIDNLQHRLQ